MAVKINLLPAEKQVSGGLASFLKITRAMGVIGLAIFLIFGLGLGVYFIFSSIELSGLKNSNNSLSSQIASLQSTETQLILLKDRIAKIKVARSIPSAIGNLELFDPFIESLSGSSRVNELDVDPLKVAAALNFGTNSDLSKFMNSIKGSVSFKNIQANSFGYNPTTGYLIELTAGGNK